MSPTKTDTTLASRLPDAPPPPYSESLDGQLSHSARALALIESYVLPELSNHPTTIVILVPSNISTLICTSQEPFKNTLNTGAFAGEKIMGFGSDEKAAIIRLAGAENRLEYWQHEAAIANLETCLDGELKARGYQVTCGPKKNAPARIAGSHESNWKPSHWQSLTEETARIMVDIDEVCIRLENEMGLYETRTGNCIVIKVEVGARKASDWD
ncbi:MAG: hypothetical protein Q9202_006523 [Teloschistes flavicans]